MTSTTTPPSESSSDGPRCDQPALNVRPTPATILLEEAIARRRLTHALGVELRRRLIPLVRANLFPLDVACRVLHRAALPPLPRMWTVQLALAVTRQAAHVTVDQALNAFHDDLDRAIREALGPSVLVDYRRPSHAQSISNSPDSEDAGSTRYEIWGHPVMTARVPAQTQHQAQARTVKRLRAAFAGLPAIEVDLGDPDGVYVEPCPYGPVELDVDTDAPPEAFTPPPGHDGGRHITEARTMQRLALQAWQYQVRQIRAALIDVLVNAEIDRPGRHAPYGLIDDLLRELGLSGLPYAHLYAITATIPVTVAADNPSAARRAAHDVVCDAFAVHPQDGLPITYTNTFREPFIVAAGTGSYRVEWHETYLVCLRATHSTRLAEHAVRLQLGVLADALPGIATIRLTTAYLGEHIDHRLEPDRD